MFVGHDVVLEVSFAMARRRFEQCIRGGWISQASDRAHADGLSGLIRVGPFGAVLGASKLVRVQTVEPIPRDDAVVLPMRWEATGALGRLFPVFDADLVLTPADADTTRLTLRGVYRAPLASVGSTVDRIVLHRVATATVRALVECVANGITEPTAEAAVSAWENATSLTQPSMQPRDTTPEASF